MYKDNKSNVESQSGLSQLSVPGVWLNLASLRFLASSTSGEVGEGVEEEEEGVSLAASVELEDCGASLTFWLAFVSLAVDENSPDLNKTHKII